MPIYEFRCPNCKEVLEEILTPQEAKEEKEVICPHCGAKVDWENKLPALTGWTPGLWK